MVIIYITCCPVTNISDTNYRNWEIFIEEASRVSSDRAIDFLAKPEVIFGIGDKQLYLQEQQGIISHTQVEDAHQNPDEVRKIGEQEILKYLSQDKVNKIWKTNKEDLIKNWKLMVATKKIKDTISRKEIKQQSIGLFNKLKNVLASNFSKNDN